jgi:hypothetical protein
MVIVDDSTGDVTDLYGVHVNNGTYTAKYYGRSNRLTSSGFGTENPFRGAGVRAIGCSALGGLVLGSDLGAGVIDHGLAVALPYALLDGAFVAPAIASDSGGGPGHLHEGERLAIPATTPKPASLSPVGSAVWDALVRYGALIVDQVGGTAASFYFDNATTTNAQAEELRGDANSLMRALATAS